MMCDAMKNFLPKVARYALHMLLVRDIVMGENDWCAIEQCMRIRNTIATANDLEVDLWLTSSAPAAN